MWKVEYVIDGVKRVFVDLPPRLRKELQRIIKDFQAPRFHEFLAKLEAGI